MARDLRRAGIGNSEVEARPLTDRQPGAAALTQAHAYRQGMTLLRTRRMTLVSLTRAVMQSRLEREASEMVCALPESEASVNFPSSWPGTSH